MKKRVLAILFAVVMIGASGCGANNENKNKSSENTDKPAAVESGTESEEQKGTESEEQKDNNEAIDITEEQALEAVKEYCYSLNPDLKEQEASEDVTAYWSVSTNEDNKIVVLHRTYTGALIRYYIDPSTGDLYITEFVPGITEEEQKTDESFNVKDYIK